MTIFIELMSQVQRPEGKSTNPVEHLGLHQRIVAYILLVHFPLSCGIPHALHDLHVVHDMYLLHLRDEQRQSGEGGQLFCG